MNNNISGTNFQGSFLINYKNTPKIARESFEKAIGEHKRQIFESFDGKKDEVLYVMKNSKDYDATQKVKAFNLRFKYMPDVDTKLRFDTESPQEVVAYINDNKPKTISKLNELVEYIGTYRSKCRARYLGAAQPRDFADEILESLKIDIKGVKTKDSKGIVTIKDNENNGLVVISPKSKFGISYVFYKPANKYEYEHRYAVNENGELLASFNTPDGIKKFKECFVKATKKNV